MWVLEGFAGFGILIGIESLHIVRPIEAPARAVVEQARERFAPGRGSISLVDCSGQTFALALRPSRSPGRAVWASFIVRDTPDDCVLTGRYRGAREGPFAWFAVEIVWIVSVRVATVVAGGPDGSRGAPR